MKKIFYNLVILIIFFARKNLQSQTIVSASPSTKVRLVPHQIGKEEFSLEKGAVINVLGVSSNKDKIAIGGVDRLESWYLIERAEGEDKQQGWVFGGCIEFGKNDIKPSFSGVNTKNLENKTIDIVPCFYQYDDEGNADCGTDCGIGSIVFLKNNECITHDYCIGEGEKHYLGKYKIEANRLIINYQRKYILVPDDEDHDDETDSNKVEVPQVKFLEKSLIQIFEIHNFKYQAVFISAEKDYEEFGGTPKNFTPKINEIGKIERLLRNK